MRMKLASLPLFSSILLCLPACGSAAEKPKPYRLPALPDRMPPVIWGSECEAPDGRALAFGGEDIRGRAGLHHTHFKDKAGAEWVSLARQLEEDNPLQTLHNRVVWELRASAKNILAKARSAYFEGREPNPEFVSHVRSLADGLVKLAEKKDWPALEKATAYQESQLVLAIPYFTAATELSRPLSKQLAGGLRAEHLKTLHQIQLKLEQAAELLDAEPAARALSPLVYDAKSNLFFLFGGDHLDCLTNDTWAFDPNHKSWKQRHPKTAPPPRANHQLTAADGVIKLTGGYTYSNNTDYMGGPYINFNDGTWSYDVAADTWVSENNAQGVADGSRTYRQGAFHPDFFIQGEKPDAAAFAATLRDLPPNTWVATKPPFLHQMQRDWGTAVIDPDHDVLLRWSGGHCAHGGSDVVMYHFSTNRW